MPHPFDDDRTACLVLVNAEGEHSLWPAFAAVPEGWTVARPAAPRDEALAWIDAHWPDQRPRSLTGAPPDQSARG
ncbi:MbtH family protein [Streptomyces capparidis]